MGARVVASWVCGAALFTAARPAGATFSIAAVDLATGEVGVAAASCIAPSEVSIVYGPVPGRGLVIAQSFLHDGTLARGVAAVAQHEAPDDVMTSLLDPAFDPEADERQLAVLDLEGRVAVHTGDRALAFASHRRYAWDATRFTVQGNRLTGAAVLDRMAAGFTGASACDLAGRLVAALLAAPAPGEGDARCTDAGVPADSAFVGVELAGEPPLRLSSTLPGVDPLPEIARTFDTFRATHPCPLLPEPPPPPPPATDDDDDDEQATCAIAPFGGRSSSRGHCELGLLGVALLIRHTRNSRKNALREERVA